MGQTCQQCSRVNPAEARYCFFDGAALSGNGSAGGPLDMGSRPFPAPFVFPSGRVCRSFDELAVACQQEWTAALELLRDGDLANFLGGVGRSDLARAAREAAAAPDRAQG